VKKIIIIIAIIIFLPIVFFYAGKQAIQSKTGDTFYDKIAQKIPESLKQTIKEKIFTSDHLRQEIFLKDKLIKELIDKENKKNSIILEKYKKIYFRKSLNNKHKLNDELLRFNYYKTLYLSNPKNEYAIASGYLDIFQDNLIIGTGDGIFLKIKLKSLESVRSSNYNEFFAEIIETNFRDVVYTPEIYKQSYYGIKDILIHNKKLLVSYTHEVKKDCFNTGLLIADFFLDKNIKFKKINYSQECAEKDKMDVSHGGGRIVPFSEDEILFTSGDYYQENKVQNLNSIFGKILKINLNTQKYEVVSYGHRNPQGLKYLKNKNLVISTEHGPIGGDEINIIDLNKDLSDRNYGWPIASYGVGSQTNPSSIIDYKKIYKSHDGFIEPLIQYTPSIGISEIIEIPNKFLNRKNNINKFFVSSLGLKASEGDLSLHYVETDHMNNQVLKVEIIPFLERIRDIVYYENSNYFILFLESDRMSKGGPSISFLFKD